MTKQECATAFVAELRALYEKYGIVITACGCCDGPRIEAGNPKAIAHECSHLLNKDGGGWAFFHPDSDK